MGGASYRHGIDDNWVQNYSRNTRGKVHVGEQYVDGIIILKYIITK
jgi:hypothetical protein